MQSIEASLDNEYLIISDPLSKENKIPMHKDFKLIATQNISNDEFLNKRSNLSNKFTSKFHEIVFPNLSEEEILEISIKISKMLDLDESIGKFVGEFHIKWISITSNLNIIKSYTLRDIKFTLMAIKNSNISPEESILFYYGSCLNSENKNLLQIELENFKKQIFLKILEFNLPGAYPTSILKLTNTYSQFFLKNRSPILLVGPSGCGKTQFSSWISQVYMRKKANILFCTPETTISDLIGSFTPPILNKYHEKESTFNIRWIDGPVVTSIKEGSILILDNLHLIPPQLTERLNPLLDSVHYENNKFLIN